MRIAILADQHGSLPPIPECDLLLLSGDLTGGNPHGPRDHSEDRWWRWLQNEFAAWLQVAPFTIATFGNHDTAIERGVPVVPKCQFLMDSGCEFGGLKFWGAPWVRKWDPLGFCLSDEELEKKWALVPKGTDILVCHSPPLGGGDMKPGTGRPPEKHHVGCKWLAHTIQRVQPKLLTCGHIHEGRGIYNLYGTTVINSALDFTIFDLPKGMGV